MATCEPQELLMASRCFSSYTERTLQAMIAGLLCQILHASNPMASCDPQTLIDDARCFACLSPNTLLTIQTQLLCEILQGGGSPGATCITCGAGAPIADATCDCSIYYSNPPNSGVWVWNSSSSSWDVILNPGP